MSMERDPTDGKVAFFPAQIGFEVETLADVGLVLDGLRKAATLYRDNHDHVGYPILILEQDNES